MILSPIMSFITAAKQRRLSNAINPIQTNYNTNPEAAKMLALAKLQTNARMPGGAYMERNIAQNYANTVGTVGRNASSGSQAMLMAAAAQGQADQSSASLQGQEFAAQQQAYANLANAQGVMINEGDKEYQDKLRKYLEDRRAKDDLMKSSLLNKANAFQGLDQAISMIGGNIAGSWASKKFGE